jgi:nicotinamide mononucleotide adenylyltransferase
MSTAIDNFTKQLHDNLEMLEDRATKLRASIQVVPKKTQAEIQLKLEEVKASLDGKKHEFDEYRAKLKTQFDERESEVKATVDEWKEQRQAKKLEGRATRAEDYATTATFLAMAMIEEAEKATLEAMSARLDAAAALETAKK